jgi:predicted small integral membrane protein
MYVGVKMAKPSAIYGLIVLELIIAILGIASGFGLLSDPSGKAMGLDVVKDKIPFQNLTLLGLWFIGPYGVLPASLAFGFWTGKHWAWKSSLYLAIIEVIWVLVQIPMVGLSIMQGVIGFIALLTIYFLYRPSVKNYLRM